MFWYILQKWCHRFINFVVKFSIVISRESDLSKIRYSEVKMNAIKIRNSLLPSRSDTQPPLPTTTSIGRQWPRVESLWLKVWTVTIWVTHRISESKKGEIWIVSVKKRVLVSFGRTIRQTKTLPKNTTLTKERTLYPTLTSSPRQLFTWKWVQLMMETSIYRSNVKPCSNLRRLNL